MRQTYIIRHWYGADTYREASYATDGRGTVVREHDFDRVGVKTVKAALRYLKGWRRQAIARGLTRTFATLTRDDARYEIIATPDGYNGSEVVASGWMKDLEEAA